MSLPLFKLRRLARLAFNNLMEHKLRGFLTMLGIIFGVSSVIAMLAIGEGASFEAREQIRLLGSGNIIINSIKPPDTTRQIRHLGALSNYGLTYADVMRIEQLFPTVKMKVPSRIIVQKVRVNEIQIRANIVGTLPSWLNNSGKLVTAGRFILPEDVEDTANVCVLDEKTARELFPLDNPLGNNIRVGQQIYVVVGLLHDSRTVDKDKKGSQAVQDIYIPLTSASRRFGEIEVKDDGSGSRSMEQVELHQIIVIAPDSDVVIPLAAAVKSMLVNYHKKNDFEVVVPQELLKQAEATKRVFNIVLGSIAAISLLVGGIGVMNIMLANVTERTREIGIRRALGATRSDIVQQFIFEALFLTISGGAIGIGLGILIPYIVTLFTEMRAIITLDSLVMAFSLSAITGLIFGIYPAMRAAAMSPIEALRHE
jgi:putative ABC transport system permease protein